MLLKEINTEAGQKIIQRKKIKNKLKHNEKQDRQSYRI